MEVFSEFRFLTLLACNLQNLSTSEGKLYLFFWFLAENLAMATDPVTSANGIMLFIPAHGMNIIQAGQRIPGTLIQPPGMAQYVCQQFGSPSNQPKRRHCVTVLEKFLKVETKTLGVNAFFIAFSLRLISVVSMHGCQSKNYPTHQQGFILKGHMTLNKSSEAMVPKLFSTRTLFLEWHFCWDPMEVMSLTW